MRNFDWGFRIAHIMGGIIEALIILVAVAVAAGVIVLLVRYLLVATRAAQLYVAQHEPPRTTAGEPTEPTSPLPPVTEPTTAASPAAPVTEPTPKPASKPRTPKTPPVQ